MLVLSMLHGGPCRGAAALLLREASEHGLLPRGPAGADGAPAQPYSFAQLQLRHPCPVDQLRGLLRRVPRRGGASGGGSLLAMQVSESTRSLAMQGSAEGQAMSLLEHLRRRELGLPRRRQPGRSLDQLRRASASELLLGRERFGLRGFVDGHLHAAYCVAFDATGDRVITSADDFLIKVWSARTCFALRSLKGVRAAPSRERVAAAPEGWHSHGEGRPCAQGTSRR